MFCYEKDASLFEVVKVTKKAVELPKIWGITCLEDCF